MIFKTKRCVRHTSSLRFCAKEEEDDEECEIYEEECGELEDD